MNRRRFVMTSAAALAAFATPLGLRAVAASTQGNAIADSANQQLGKPYVWDTQGPDTFDCSGLVQYCVAQATGDVISASSYDQATLGVPVQASDLQRGDILCFDSEENGSCGHVAIYDGPGRMINALNENYGVVVSDPFSGYFAPIFLGARRLYGAAIDAPTSDDSGTPAASPFASGDTISVSDGPLNVRSHPALSSGIVTVVRTGAAMTVTGDAVAADGYIWCPITTEAGVAGWVASEFCAAGVVDGPHGDSSTWAYGVSCEALNLRTGAGTSNAVIATMPNGERLNINDGPVATGGYTWYSVTTQHYGAGWCANFFDAI